MANKPAIFFLGTTIFFAGLSGYAFNKQSMEKVVSIKGYGDITRAEFNDYLEKKYGQIDLKQMIFEEIANDKYPVTDKEVDAEIEGYKKQMNITKDEEFEKIVKEQAKMSMKEFRETVKKSLVITKSTVDGVKISEKDIKAVYEERKVEVRASHILLTDEAKAKEMQEKLAKGEKFEDLAKEFSNDPGSKDKAGDLGYFPKGQMMKAFEDKAFSMKVGEISDIVKTEAGYHLIKLTDKRTLKYDEIKESIKKELMAAQAKQQTDVMDAMFKEEKKNINIKDKDYKDLLKEAPVMQQPAQ